MAPTHNLNSTVSEIQHPLHNQQSTFGKMDRSGFDGLRNSNTLQSVLRGEIPSAYMHLTSQYRSDVKSQLRNDMHNDVDIVTCANGSKYSNVRSYREREHTFRPYQCSSPLRSTLNQSPHSYLIPRSPKRSNSPYMDKHSMYGNGSCQTEAPQYLGQLYDRASPAYESRSSPFQDSGSPFIGNSPYNAGSPSRSFSPSRNSTSPYSVHQIDHSPYSSHGTGSPYSPHHAVSSRFTPHENSSSPRPGSQFADDVPSSVYDSKGYSDNCQDMTEDQPIDLSCHKHELKNSSHAYLPEEVECQDGPGSGSLLRTLLRPGKQTHLYYSSDNGRDSPGSDVYKPEVQVTGTTRVTLAKKMVYPITSRVSDWLVKIVQFSKSIPEFNSMSSNDKMTLLLNSWTRMLLLLMAENDYEFAVTPLYSDEKHGEEGATPSPDEPTMKSVEGIQSFIRKCKNMTMDQKEYALMRMAVLFNAGNVGLDDTELVEKLNSAVQQLLQQHVTSARPKEVMRYSRILMLLPSLYGINCRMVENLFCKRINSDMQVLLKEMLQNL